MGKRIRFVLGLALIALSAMAGVAVAGFGPSQGSGSNSGSGSGSQTLAQTITNGATTGVNATTNGANITLSQTGGQPSDEILIGNGALYADSSTNVVIQGPANAQLKAILGNQTLTSGTVIGLNVPGTFSTASNSSTVAQGMLLNPTINYSGGTKTGHYEALSIQAVETSLPTGTNYLIRASAGAAGTTDKFTVDNSGATTIAGNSILSNFGTGILGLSDSTTGTSFRVFNTTDSTSSPTNSEWAELSWSANLLTFQSAKTGTGTLRNLAITFPNLTLAANTLTVTTFAAGNGAAGTPSYMFSANTDRGLFNDTGNSGIGFTIGGGQKAVMTASVFQLLSTMNMQIGGVYRSPDATAGAPGYSFTNNTDRGIYNDTGNSGIGFTIGGGEKAVLAATVFQLFGSVGLQVGGNTTLVGTTTCQGAGSANGQALKIDTASELLTLSTGGTTTDTAANLLPAGAMIVAVDCRITTTITTATNWSVGDATVAARFSAANSTLTSGTTSIGLDQLAGTGTSSSRQNAAAKVRITTTGTPGAGAIRITVHYIQMTAPTS